jgi:hypothetical protein
MGVYRDAILNPLISEDLIGSNCIVRLKQLNGHRIGPVHENDFLASHFTTVERKILENLALMPLGAFRGI